jgi:hypothetical protein
MRETSRSSKERKEIALEACKARGAVVETLEELNEMLETPLIREAADGNAKNLVLLLEAAANIEAQQINGFTALHQAGYCTFGFCPSKSLMSWLEGRVN